MRIAVCDDQQIFVDEILNKIKDYLERRNYNYQINTFTSGLDLVSSNKYNCQYDIIFLDVEMPVLSGEEVAGELLKQNSENTLIIFTTSHSDFAKYGYLYKAFRFIDKAELDDCINQVIEDAIKELSTMPVNKTVLINGEDISINNIIYIMADGKCTNIILNNNTTITVNKGFKDFVGSAKFMHFIISRRGVLINSDYIDYVSDRIIQLTNGDKVEIPRGRKDKIKNQIFNMNREVEHD